MINRPSGSSAIAHGLLNRAVTTSVSKVKFDFTSGARVWPSNAGVWLDALGGPVGTGGPEGSGIPLELELEEEPLLDEELLELELLELELLELELLEVDELELELLLELLLPLLLPPQAARSAASNTATLDLVSRTQLTDCK